MNASPTGQVCQTAKIGAYTLQNVEQWNKDDFQD